MARVYGANLSELWGGQPVIIESKPGAQGAVGTEYTARQAADGYTFTVANLQPVAVNPLLSKVPYSVEKDFVAVSLISQGPNVLTVRADSPFRSLTDIINFSKQNPGKLNYGTSRPGSVSHLSAESRKNTPKLQAVEVNYRAGVIAVQALLGGQITFIFSDSLPVMQHTRAGKRRGLCIPGPEPFSLVPDMQPCQSAAPGLVAVNWWGVLLPAGTPRPIVNKLNADTVEGPH